MKIPKSFKFVCTLTLGFQMSLAQAMVFSAPSVPPAEFQKYILQKNQVSYTQGVRDQASQEDKLPHESVIAFAQQTLQDTHPVFSASWEQLQTDLELNLQDREAFQSLADKVGAENPQDRNLAAAGCRYLILDHKLSDNEAAAPHLQACHLKTQKWRLGFNLADDDLLLIDGVPFNKSELPASLIPGKYHWRLVSNRFQDQEWVATLSEVVHQTRVEKPWVNGDCDHAQLDHPDFAVLSQAQIYFDSECLRPGIRQNKTFGEWAGEHKVLWWGLGILAAGAVAYQLRDKTLVFTQP